MKLNLSELCSRVCPSHWTAPERHWNAAIPLKCKPISLSKCILSFAPTVVRDQHWLRAEITKLWNQSRFTNNFTARLCHTLRDRHRGNRCAESGLSELYANCGTLWALFRSIPTVKWNLFTQTASKRHTNAYTLGPNQCLSLNPTQRINYVN